MACKTHQSVSSDYQGKAKQSEHHLVLDLTTEVEEIRYRLKNINHQSEQVSGITSSWWTDSIGCGVHFLVYPGLYDACNEPFAYFVEIGLKIIPQDSL